MPYVPNVQQDYNCSIRQNGTTFQIAFYQSWYLKHDVCSNLNLGLHRPPDIRPIILPNTGYPAIYPAKNKFHLIICIFFENCTPVDSSNSFLDLLKFSQFFRLKQFGWHCSQYLQFRQCCYQIYGQISGTGKWNRISSRISGATLFKFSLISILDPDLVKIIRVRITVIYFLI